MTRGVGVPSYVTYDPIWDAGDPVEPGYPVGYRTMVSLFASPSYHPNTMIMQVMDNEEYANSPPAVGRRSAVTGLWEGSGPALIDYGDGAGTFVWDTFIPTIVWPPTSDFLYTVKYKSTFTDTLDDFQYVELESTYPFTFSKRSPTPQDKGRSDYWGRLHSFSYNSGATMLVGQQNGSGISPDIHTKWSMWAPGPNAIGFFKSTDAGFSSRYGDGTTGNGTIPQGFIIDKHDHLWIFTHATVNQSVACWLDEYSWSVVGTDVTLTFLNRYQLNNQDTGFNTWSYNIFGATYNEDLDEIVFYWTCAFPSETHTTRDPVAINYGGSGNTPTQYRITHWDLDTRSKKLSDSDSILITKESDGLLLTDFGVTDEEPNWSGVPGFLGSDMNEDGDRYVGTWTKQTWTCMIVYDGRGSGPRTTAGNHVGFFYVDTDTGVASKYIDWPEDILPETFDSGPDPPGTPGVYTWAGAIYEPLTEKFWAGRRNQGFAGINGPEPEEVWYYVTEGFGIYGWDSDCLPCEEDLSACGDTTEPAVDGEWPHDVLRPRHVGLHVVPATLGGGMSYGDLENSVATSTGYWRVEYREVMIRSKAQRLAWRKLEAIANGCGGVLRIPLYDSKRAPWVTVGGAITVTTPSGFAVGATSGTLNVTSAGVIYEGMHFSYNDRAYRIVQVNSVAGSLYHVTIWPNVRTAIPAAASLEFRRPTLRVRLRRDDGMDVTLKLLKHAEPNVEFEEDK